jgi:hypothetical protein
MDAKEEGTKIKVEVREFVGHGFPGQAEVRTWHSVCKLVVVSHRHVSSCSSQSAVAFEFEKMHPLSRIVPLASRPTMPELPWKMQFVTSIPNVRKYKRAKLIDEL